MRKPPEAALTTAHLSVVEPVATMRIGEVAERLGLSLRSIRYYEEAGLIGPTARTRGGFRLYSELDIQRLLLVMQMKPLDFALDDMRRLLDALDTMRDSAAAPADVDEAAVALEDFASDVDGRWEALRQRVDIATAFRGYLRGELDELSQARGRVPDSSASGPAGA
ncbi:MAG TPA: MerR family transcriptional regulator [Dermatophilaceae bacterium]|nr:MerR family transcriptional regulator [Dermatophilaceae bacterium]